jgi:hypothetical protein
MVAAQAGWEMARDPRTLITPKAGPPRRAWGPALCGVFQPLLDAVA